MHEHNKGTVRPGKLGDADFKADNFIFSIYGCLACMYFCALHALCSQDQKRASEPLELEVLIIARHHVGSWN